MKPDRKRGIIIGAAIGDALCSPLDGLGPGHIRSIFGRVREYLDPAPALKGRLDRWKKPALYTSISQTIMLILISARGDGGPDMGRFLRSLEDNPPVEGNPCGAFRHPGPAERNLIEKRVRGPEASPSFSCARTAVIAAAARAVSGYGASPLSEGPGMELALNREVHSLAAALIFGSLLEALAAGPGMPEYTRLFEMAIAAGERARRAVDSRSGLVFAAGINPESLLRATMDFQGLFERLARLSVREDAERAICEAVNRLVKSPVSRATVNHPLAVPPYALVLCGAGAASPAEPLYAAAEAGGSTGPLGALCGAIAGAAIGTSWIPPKLLDGLVNRRRLLSLAGALADSGKAGEPREFLASEAQLTRKEIEEYAARNRHRPGKAGKKRTKGDPERELSRHVVESWTKLDKARWKKEKRRSEGDG